MEHYSLIKDLGVVLLSGGIASIICRRLGLSAIVGYLFAGIIIGPFTPPFSLIEEQARIKELSDVGLVFVMFGIGLHLSLSRLAKMGVATLGATALGALFMLGFTLVLGNFFHWTGMQSTFVAAMLMVSSSAVISKMMQELNLSHDRTAQMSLAITIVEDVVAVIMLTLLVSHETGGGGIGGVLGVMSAFVVLLIAVGLLLMPRILNRIEAKGDPEIQTIVVAGLLLLLSFITIQAGYSLALGAFLFGAIVAELRQKVSIEKNFAGIQFMFSSVFFVSIGMMINPSDLKEIWLLVLIMCSFALIFRPIACGIALILVGNPPREAKRGGLLLAPLGEFTFIIASAGIGAQILPGSFYPLAVALSVITVLVTPIINRYSEPILNFSEKIEPRFVTKAITAYQSWLSQLQNRPSSGSIVWKLTKKRLLQLVLEMTFISGVLIFSRPILESLETTSIASWMGLPLFRSIFWGLLAIIVLIPLVAVWRNLSAMAMILAENMSSSGNDLLKRLIETAIKAIAGFGIISWIYALLPISAISGWGWLIIIAAGLIIALLFFKRLVYWHSSWETSLQEVFTHDTRQPEEVRAEARNALGAGLEAWDLKLQEYIVPDNAAYAGQNLRQLAIPTRFGCSILEIERNGYVITTMRPELQLYPGDSVLILGPKERFEELKNFLQTETRNTPSSQDEAAFDGSVLETCAMPAETPEGQTLANLSIAKDTGVRVVGIRRGEEQIINPTGEQVLNPGDHILVVGSLDELRAFRLWLKTMGTKTEDDTPLPATS